HEEAELSGGQIELSHKLSHPDIKFLLVARKDGGVGVKATPQRLFHNCVDPVISADGHERIRKSDEHGAVATHGDGARGKRQFRNDGCLPMRLRLRSSNPYERPSGGAEVIQAFNGVQSVRERKEIDDLMFGHLVVLFAVATEPVQCSSKLTLVEA